MRHIVCLAVLVPIVALAAGTAKEGPVVAPGVSLQAVNSLPGDGGAGPSGPRTSPGPSREARFTIGTVDTIGGTTYDYATNGPAYRMLVMTPGRGVHALFMYAPDTDTLFANRNMRYNFYDFGSRTWSWTSADFMEAGVNVFAVKTGYGNLDVDANGAAVVSAHYGTADGFAPIVARDADVGVAIFDYAPGAPTLNRYVWPYVGVNLNGSTQLAMNDDQSRNKLYWSRMATWGNWEAAASMPAPQPEPFSPTQNIAASKVAGSNKLCITWVGTPPDNPYQQCPGFYRESEDGGDNWGGPVDLGYPPAFHPGSETVPSYSVSSLFPFYDHNNNLHIVGNVGPYVRDTNWVIPGQIWHWCAANPDTWNLIRLASPDSWNGSCGNNVMVCARPSLGEDGNGNLFVAWEEFGGVNVEPTTGRLRADIWYSHSTDNGVTWVDAIRITDGGDVTYRYPSILNPIGDTVMVSYLIDQIAGFFVQSGEGGATNNPVVVQKWANPYGVEEGPSSAPPRRIEITAPSPARGAAVISYALPRAGDVSLVVYDATGRPVQTLASGRRDAGRYAATWNARGAAAGIYFCALESAGNRTSRKIVLTE